MEQPRQPDVSGFISQYQTASNDMRFYAEQRFKVLTVFLAYNALILNMAANLPKLANIALGITTLVISYACYSWEAGTTRWWGTLIESIKKIETRLIALELMDKIYHNYPNQKPVDPIYKIPVIKPSKAVVCIYYSQSILWIFFIFYNSYLLFSGDSANLVEY